MAFDETQCKTFFDDLSTIRKKISDLNIQLAKYEKCISLVYSEEIDRYDNGLVKIDENGDAIFKYVKPIDVGTDESVTVERQNNVMTSDLITEIESFIADNS